jgi:hypothetical protein
MDFVAACKECEWSLTQGSKDDITHFGKLHSRDFRHRIEFKEEYVDDGNAYESYEPEQLFRDRDDESEQYFEEDFNSRDRFTS